MRPSVTPTGCSFPGCGRSDVLQVLTTDLARVGQGTYHLLHLVSTSIVMAVYLAVAVRLAPAMSAMTLTCAVALGLALRHKHRLAHSIGTTFTRVHNDLYAAVTEHLSGMKVAKSYGAEPRHVALFEAIINATTALTKAEASRADLHTSG